MTFRVVLIGFGGIGSGVAGALREGAVAGVELAGAVVRTSGAAAAAGVRELEFEDALEVADLFVECAGGGAVRQYGPRIVGAGKDLLIVSVGALADPELRATLIDEGPGRTFISNGAIGGLDLLRGVAIKGGLARVELVTRKLPGTLVQPWMDDEEASRLRATEHPVTVFEGSVTEAIALFPHTLNVAVALAHTTGMWEETIVRLVADPQAVRINHEISASGPVGTYAFSITNEPQWETSTTSGVVAGSALSGIRVIAGVSGVMV